MEQIESNISHPGFNRDSQLRLPWGRSAQSRGGGGGEGLLLLATRSGLGAMLISEPHVLQLINRVIWNYSQQTNREQLNQGGWQDKQWSKVEVSKFATGSSWPPPCPPTITSSHNKILGAVIKSISEEKHLSAPKDFGERLSVSILGLIELCCNIVINHLVPTNSSKYYLYKIYTVFSLL